MVVFLLWENFRLKLRALLSLSTRTCCWLFSSRLWSCFFSALSSFMASAIVIRSLSWPHCLIYICIMSSSQVSFAWLSAHLTALPNLRSREYFSFEIRSSIRSSCSSQLVSFSFFLFSSRLMHPSQIFSKSRNILLSANLSFKLVSFLVIDHEIILRNSYVGSEGKFIDRFLKLKVIFLFISPLYSLDHPGWQIKLITFIHTHMSSGTSSFIYKLRTTRTKILRLGKMLSILIYSWLESAFF